MISNEFLKLFEVATNHKPFLSLNIYYSKRCDWVLTVHEGVSFGDNTVQIIHVNDCDLALVFAKAYVELAKWLCENNGGY